MILHAFSVQRGIALNAGFSTIKVSHAKNIKILKNLIRAIKFLKILSKVPNTSSVQAASFGLKNHLDATI
jgi:hypothetical protein